MKENRIRSETSDQVVMVALRRVPKRYEKAAREIAGVLRCRYNDFGSPQSIDCVFHLTEEQDAALSRVYEKQDTKLRAEGKWMRGYDSETYIRRLIRARFIAQDKIVEKFNRTYKSRDADRYRWDAYGMGNVLDLIRDELKAAGLPTDESMKDRYIAPTQEDEWAESVKQYMKAAEKTRENGLRRRLNRLGCQLIPEYGAEGTRRYAIIHVDDRWRDTFGKGLEYEFTLDGVEAWIKDTV